jgi:hypothetical protein
MHELKVWPEFFEPLQSGVKTFDLRRNDRGFKLGDMLHLREWSPDSPGGYTGRELHKRICYKLDGVGTGAISPLIGLLRGYCILGLMDVTSGYPRTPPTSEQRS